MASDAQALIAEEREAAAAPTPDAYRALLERRLAASPVFLDAQLLERMIAEKPWADALRPVAAKVLFYPASPPETVVLVNTFPRVPTTAAEQVMIQVLGLRRGSLHSANGGFDQAFDRLVAHREFRARSLVRGHVTATVRVRACLALYRIRPILLVRDIFDAIASYCDDTTDPPVAPGYRLASLPATVRRRIRVLRMASQLVDFYATWSIEAAAGRATLHRWEDVKEDWPGFLADRLAEHGRPLPRDTIATAMRSLPADAHSETGVGDTLSDEDRGLVRALYAQYPVVDFRPIDAGAPGPG